MTEILYTDRIIQLIELNHNDSEILKIIHEEYNIYLSIDAVQKKRNSKNLSDFNQSNSQSLQKRTNLMLEYKTDLIREMFEDIYYVPLTKKEIVNKIHAKYQLYLTQTEIKEILWTRLRNEIVYDKDEWTYRLKNKIEEINIQDQIIIASKIDNNISNKNFDFEILIDNSNFKIYKKKEFFKPIFYYNFNSLNGDNEIIINLNHELYKPEYEEFIIKIACSMYFTKSSMTSNVIDIYINRLLSNIALIHE